MEHEFYSKICVTDFLWEICGKEMLQPEPWGMAAKV